jgi:Domain of unknown function (DUF4411)
MYVLDANVFIEAKNKHYGFDFMPGFWEWIEAKHSEGVLCSIVEVKQEIDFIQDELATWAASRRNMFRSPDASVQPSLQQLASWANSNNFTQAAINEFLGDADYPLVAYAHAHRYTVVTQEGSDPRARKKIFIPDACTAFAVNCITPWEMLRTEGAKFVIAP